MVRMVILNTAYTHDRIYHLDDGLTIGQLEDLCEGILEQQIAAQGRLAETLGFYMMGIAAAIQAGMTGKFEGFNLARKELFTLADRLQGFVVGAPSGHGTLESTMPVGPQVTGTPLPPNLAVPQGVPPAVANHPLFTANLGFALD